MLPGPDGRVREELRAGVATPGEEERESWARLPSGAEMLAEAGAAEVTAGRGGTSSGSAPERSRRST